MKEVVGVIPARYKSSRFPGKPLISILGKPMIIHVAEKVEQALGKENTIIATDDDRIANVGKEYGFTVVMTSDQHKTGTDRLAEVASKVDAKIYINIQGDEPVVNPQDIKKVYEIKKANPDCVINGYGPLLEDEDPFSVNIPKVVFDINKKLLYMSRLAVPGIKGSNQTPNYYKQICIYGFSKLELELFNSLDTKTYLESFEDIEILRFLEMGVSVKMVLCENNSIAVDVPEDVEKVE